MPNVTEHVTRSMWICSPSGYQAQQGQLGVRSVIHNVLMQTQGGGGVSSVEPHRGSSFSGLQNQHIFMYNQAENAHIHQGAKYRKTHFKHHSQIFLQPLNKFKLFIFNVLLFFFSQQITFLLQKAIRSKLNWKFLKFRLNKHNSTEKWENAGRNALEISKPFLNGN